MNTRERSKNVFKKKKTNFGLEEQKEEVVETKTKKEYDPDRRKQLGPRVSLKNVAEYLPLNLKKPVFYDCKKEFLSGNKKVRKNKNKLSLYFFMKKHI